MNPFDDELNRRLDILREQYLFRELRRVDSAQGPHLKIDGKTLLNFSSNDYLGLAKHPALKEAALKAVEKFGAGAGASRLVCGSLAPFHELEDRLAAFKKTESALTFSTGYAVAMGVITALAAKDDVIILDKLVHACIVDAAKLSGAKLRIYDHNDLNDLEQILAWTRARPRPAAHVSRTLIITESIFSMDGDAAPLREIVALKEKYGAWLMVDEAHATGIIGPHGCGLVNQLGLRNRIEIQMGTLGKALGASGGYVCGSRTLVDFLINRARSFIFSTASVPAAAAAAIAALELIQTPEGDVLRKSLFARVDELNSKLKIKNSRRSSAIIPIILGDETAALAAAGQLLAHGIFVPAIRFPTVARGAARLRVTLTAAHTAADVAKLSAALPHIPA